MPDSITPAGGHAYDEAIRDEAVRNVDGRHGYTMEWAPSPEAHREEYDVEEARLHAARG